MTTKVCFEAAFLKVGRKGKAPPTPTQPQVSVHADRKARRLALAYLIERRIESGELKDYVDAAERLGLTRARLTQVMNMLLLPSAEQEAVLSVGVAQVPSSDAFTSG